VQLTRTLLDVVLDVLRSAKGKPADSALRQVLRGRDIFPPDRRAISQAVFAYFRWFGFLDPAAPLNRNVEKALDLAAQFTANPRFRPDTDLMARALPPWVHTVTKVTPALIRELQKEPRLWLRARPGQGPELARKLGDSAECPSLPDSIWYKGEQDLYHTPEFRNGEFEIQDISSQMVGFICDPKTDETWWDACAGEGGKTLHLCDLMQNKGLVWASDPAEWRLGVLKRRAARAKLFNYRLKAWRNTEKLPLKAKVDGVLIDAPCSGIGTWGRNPHARWTTQPKDVFELARIQSKLLENAASAVKPGGRLIYSVCTLAEAETAEVADLFETTHPAFKAASAPDSISRLLPRMQEHSGRFAILPQTLNGNGMFIAIWEKAD
jgi:16S rRNA (cytosine967-C5)-methyltransferase